VSVLTETRLREELRHTDLDALEDFSAPAGVIVTPAAKTWLMDHKIGLVVGGKRVLRGRLSGSDRAASALALGQGASSPGAGPGDAGPDPETGAGPAPPSSDSSAADGQEGPVSALPAFRRPDRYAVLTGGYVEAKPEHMTALRGNLLVLKDHPAIALRGRLDSLEAAILEAQVLFRRLGLEKGVEELGEVLLYVKRLLRAEVLEEPCEAIALFGLDDAELRARSHSPQRYFGIPHFAASVDDGEAVIRLNSLRTASREVELAAYNAFKRPDGQPPSRPDLIQALNRLSSAFYLMMFKAKAKEYGL
jgi:ethanolamine utilization cobalamin adenosyltransferase